MIPRAMLGAFVGDAIGAVLEFSEGPISQERVHEAMRYPGGGPHRLGKGQITDDGELTLALWSALCSSELPRPLSMMKAYADWLYSVPFDIGFACRNAFDCYRDVMDGSMLASECASVIQRLNGRSEANGALMRATAIASYVDQFHKGDHVLGLSLAKQDALLSHPSPVCVEVNQVYVYALLLLLEGMSPVVVWGRVEEYVAKQVKSDVVRRWFYESLDLSSLDCTQQQGHVRWAFVMSIYMLRHPEISFQSALEMVLSKGGDTDTNACIVGGLVACYQPIPERLSTPVLAFDSTLELRDRRWRPAEYCVGRVFGVL